MCGCYYYLKLKKKSGTGDTEVELTGSNISGWDTQPEITDEVVIGCGTSGITTYEALHEALQTGGGSAVAPTLITLGSDITIPAGGGGWETFRAQLDLMIRRVEVNLEVAVVFHRLPSIEADN